MPSVSQIKKRLEQSPTRPEGATDLAVETTRRTRALWSLAAAVAGSLVMQLAIIGTAALMGGASAYDGTSSMLLSSRPQLSDVAAVLGMNSAWLAAIAMLAWPIARLWSWSIHDTWDRPGVNTAARVLYPLVAALLLIALWWVFSQQAMALDQHLESHWALFATLAHGTFELTALILPLSVAASCIIAPAERPGRLLLRALAVSLPLLVCAAFIEIYLTPHLLFPFRLHSG